MREVKPTPLSSLYIVYESCFYFNPLSIIGNILLLIGQMHDGLKFIGQTMVFKKLKDVACGKRLSIVL